MMAGKFNTPIRIMKSIEVENEYGERVQKYVHQYDTRASIQVNNGGRGIENYEIFYSHNKTFFLRSYVPIDDTSIIEYNSKKWRVINIESRTDFNDKQVVTEMINE